MRLKRVRNGATKRHNQTPAAAVAQGGCEVPAKVQQAQDLADAAAQEPQHKENARSQGRTHDERCQCHDGPREHAHKLCKPPLSCFAETRHEEPTAREHYEEDTGRQRDCTRP